MPYVLIMYSGVLYIRLGGKSSWGFYGSYKITDNKVFCLCKVSYDNDAGSTTSPD